MDDVSSTNANADDPLASQDGPAQTKPIYKPATPEMLDDTRALLKMTFKTIASDDEIEDAALGIFNAYGRIFFGEFVNNPRLQRTSPEQTLANLADFRKHLDEVRNDIAGFSWDVIDALSYRIPSELHEFEQDLSDWVAAVKYAHRLLDLRSVTESKRRRKEIQKQKQEKNLPRAPAKPPKRMRLVTRRPTDKALEHAFSDCCADHFESLAKKPITRKTGGPFFDRVFEIYAVNAKPDSELVRIEGQRTRKKNELQQYADAGVAPPLSLKQRRAAKKLKQRRASKKPA